MRKPSMFSFGCQSLIVRSLFLLCIMRKQDFYWSKANSFYLGNARRERIMVVVKHVESMFAR